MIGPDVAVALAVGLAVVLSAHAVLGALDAGRVRRRLRPGAEPRRGQLLDHRLTAWRPRARRRQRTLALDALAPMLDDVARQTRSGRSVPAARAAALTGRAELAAWFPQRGAPDPVLPPEAALASRALGVAAASPSNAADTCERAARAIRDRRAIAAERAAQSAPARLSARVMTVLPLGVAAWSVVVDADVRAVLLTTPLGWGCLAGGLGLNLAGRWWTHRLVTGGSP